MSNLETGTPVTTIHEHIKVRTDLAKTYAEDGAFLTASEVLRELAEDVVAHARATY